MKIEHIEKNLGMKLPERHKRAMLDPRDPIHSICDFLLPRSTDKLSDMLEENGRLHDSNIDPWPSYLVAFASNGCADFFAYDLRSKPYSIIYMDPDRTVQENLKAADKFTFPTFEDWYEHEVA